MTEVMTRKTKVGWARFLNKIATDYPQAEKIKLVMDDLNTHSPCIDRQ